MASDIRLNIPVSPQIKATVDDMAASLGLSKSAVVRRALGLMQALEEGRGEGRYVGLTSNRENLDIVLLIPR